MQYFVSIITSFCARLYEKKKKNEKTNRENNR